MSTDWPIYFKDRLIISNLNSANVVATLWTPKEAIQKLVDPDNYLVMGQLYTKKGINFLVRNILANPKITHIYLCGNDLMQSGECLVKLFANGISEDHKIIEDESGQIDNEITLEAIDLLRKNVKLIDLRGAENLMKLKTDVIKNDDAKKWNEPMIFADPPKPQVSTYPAEIDLIKIRRATISDAYLAVLKHIEKFGLDSKPPINNSSSDSNTMKELLNLSVVITDEDPDNPVIPDFMPFGQEDLNSYIHGFFDPKRNTEDYTYGERLFNYSKDEIDELKQIYPWLAIDRFQKYFSHGGIDQVAVNIVRKLSQFQYDKGAIALLGNPYTDVFPQRPPKKIPCLFLIQCQIYQGKLNLTAYFRSNDMYNAWALNAFALRKLQKNITEKLEVEMGNLITISNMAHVYKHNFEDMKSMLEKNYKGYYCEWDPRGNFIINIEETEIVAKLMSPDGVKELKEWRFDGTKKLIAQDACFVLENELTISTLGNALYIGRELERAENAIKFGKEYKQDLAIEL